MGRPLIPPPEGFADAYERHGWAAKDMLGMNTTRFLRCLDACDRPALKNRRRNYVLGMKLNRVSSLKLG